MVQRQTMASEPRYCIPVFNMKEEPYETYKFELECWTKVTSFEKKCQGVEVLLSLPESSKDEYKVCEYIISKIDNGTAVC